MHTTNITPEQKNLMRKIINCFENGRTETDYSSIYIYKDGPNDIRALTLGFGLTEYGNLKTLIKNYIDAAGVFAEDFRKYVNLIGRIPLTDNKAFIELLVKSAKLDPIFRQCQDAIFELMYFAPAIAYFNKGGYKEILSAMIILDSFIHSGSMPSFLVSRFPERSPANGGDEKTWMKQYVATRRSWLSKHSRTILRKTVYRMAFFEAQFNKNNWSLNLPLNANGINITQ